MYCVGNERLQKRKREEDEQCAQKKFHNRAKFCKLQNFANLEISSLQQTKPALLHLQNREQNSLEYANEKQRNTL